MEMKVVFVCLGNICRSPLAEGIAKKYAYEKKYNFAINSAGTSGYHNGEPPHKISIEVAKTKGIDISNQKSQKVSPYMEADFYIAMDEENVIQLKNLGIAAKNILKIGDFGLGGKDIPDPYYGGIEGFYEVYDLLEVGVKNCLDYLFSQQKFTQDIEKIYIFINDIDQEIFNLYESLKDKNHSFYQELSLLCEKLHLPVKDSVILALADRILQLKEGSLLQELKNLNFAEEKNVEIKTKLFVYIEEFYKNRAEKILAFIDKEELLSDFYRAIFRGVHEIGSAINVFAKAWQKTLFLDLYPYLEKKFPEDEILKILQPTMDQEKLDNQSLVQGDRSYSVIAMQGEEIKTLSYYEAFPEIMEDILQKITQLLENLQKKEDLIYQQKAQYIQYFKALQVALKTQNKEDLIVNWQKVDAAWMQITTPLQIGHFFEYYEDKYRHSVAPEWDLRLSLPQKDDKIGKWMKECFTYFTKKLNPSSSLIKFTKKALDQVMVFPSIPALFYGTNLNGLFSAQVVPNDERITEKYGKKIFAFPDRIIKIMQNKPRMQISYLTFGKEVMDNYYNLLFHQEKLWYEIYEITTNGHEYGHILWMEEDTQILMNLSGMFKNIEEFKATAGGLCSFFLQEEKEVELFQEIMLDNIIRAVGLMGWREQDEVLPYYYEGLIHLHGAFITKSLSFKAENNPKLYVHVENFLKLREWYLEVYEDLAKHYIEKKDAKNFLEKFAKNKEPVLKEAREFVAWYWEQYQRMGREVIK
ncbi:invasion protein CiaB [Helicobacter anatolicus]|uniref:invasion protein CiaB n=1 Tax=Helicobacter anatolicus TaxID=2905874 RepID=UPI002FCE1A21